MAKFGMDAIPQKSNPLRLPNWRAVRAIYLADHSPRPRRPASCDDLYVRTYWHYLTQLIAAGADEQRRLSSHIERPHIHQAHELFFKSELETRQMLEAWLLTREAFSDIGARFAIEASVVESFERLHFNVRDRLDCSDWIAKVIKGSRNRANLNRGTTWELQRGMFYRMVAVFGGPIALDALTSGGVLRDRPKKVADLIRYFHGDLSSTIQRRATLATCDLPIDPASVIQILKVARRRP